MTFSDTVHFLFFFVLGLVGILHVVQFLVSEQLRAKIGPRCLDRRSTAAVYELDGNIFS